MKKVVRLNESQLHNIVKESVRRVILEGYEEELVNQYQALIDSLGDGQSKKVTRQTVLKGDRPKPLGVITRHGSIIKFQPARGMAGGYGHSWRDTEAAQQLADMALLSAFSI